MNNTATLQGMEKKISNKAYDKKIYPQILDSI